MRVISRRTLQDYWQAHPDVEAALRAWLKEAQHAAWQSFQDIKERYNSADILPGNRVVFNIKGNHYRLVVVIHHSTGIVYIRFIGTHAEYDRIDAEKI
jgi:mRNA interferase HigB